MGGGGEKNGPSLPSPRTFFAFFFSPLSRSLEQASYTRFDVLQIAMHPRPLFLLYVASNSGKGIGIVSYLVSKLR